MTGLLDLPTPEMRGGAASIATVHRQLRQKGKKLRTRELLAEDHSPIRRRAVDTWNTRFARSTPTVLTYFVDALSFQGDVNITSLAPCDAVGVGASTPSLSVHVKYHAAAIGGL